MRALLPAWVITGKVIELQKSLLDKWKFFRPFLNRLTANGKYSLNSKDKLMKTIQMLWSQKENIFSEFSAAFFESALNFEYFQKKTSLMAYVFPNYRPRKTSLDQCLNAPVWEEISTCNMVNSPKHWFNLNESDFTSSSDHCEGNWVAKVTLRHMKFLQTFT